MLPFLIILWTAVLHPLAPAASVQVTITGIEAPQSGPLYVLLWKDDTGFPTEPDAAAHRQRIDARGSTGTATLTDIPNGTYAISVWQDLNDNGEADRNFIGMPKEPVGLLNLNGLGRPSFKKSSIALTGGDHRVSIKLLNQ